MDRKFLSTLKDRKQRGEKIVMLTAYDAPFASILDKSGEIDLILVGDSLGMVVQGKDSTREVTMQHMRYHVQIVASSSPHTPVIGDLPYHSFETAETALENARMLMEAGASAVKFEGSNFEAARAVVDNGIPLMGHLGLLPQTAKKFSVRGKDAEEADRMLADAEELQRCGIFSLVLESIPRGLAGRITDALEIPTIGIGAGPECDGQVLVTYDMVGLTRGRVPRFVKRYADLGASLEQAVHAYAEEVKSGSFPSDAQSYH